MDKYDGHPTLAHWLNRRQPASADTVANWMLQDDSPEEG